MIPNVAGPASELKKILATLILYVKTLLTFETKLGATILRPFEWRLCAPILLESTVCGRTALPGQKSFDQSLFDPIFVV